MRSALDSPFSPGSDTIPQIWAGRSHQMSDWRDVLRPRRIAGIHERGRTILGESGSGKSSLVRKILRDAAEMGDWTTPQLRIPTGTDPLKRVATALLDLSAIAGLPSRREQRISHALRHVESVAISGVSLSLRHSEGPEPYTALTELLIEISRAALREEEKMVLLHLDEVQNIDDEKTRSQLLIALGDALTHEELVHSPAGHDFYRSLPLAVFLTGLPEFADMANGLTGATFARRFATTTLRPLDDASLLSALQPFVTEGWPIITSNGEENFVFMEPSAQKLIIRLACGEPFLFQLAGERAWFAGSGPIITEEEVRKGWESAKDEAQSHVQRILDRLPERELEFLHTMAQLPKDARTLKTIAAEMGLKKSTDAGTTARRLEINRGIIERGTLYHFQHRAIEAYLTSTWPRI
ncbi:MAG: ATP-binding protein [Actinomycetaceae bacterium]|nr:ATP-binding protein [Actinomycetaceae bacterium]